MSIRSRSENGVVGTTANTESYTSSFRRHTHELVRLGYRRMNAPDFASTDEPAITGELVRSIRLAMEDEQAPRWVSHYAVHDDPPQNLPGMTGKRRPRVDIEVERAQRGPRPRFRFEAKRLTNTVSLTDYVGNDGIGCFLNGRYGSEDPECGMLGYVQIDDEAAWATELGGRFTRHAADLRVADGGEWNHSPVTRYLRHTYRTAHERESLPDVEIYHTLLKFC